FVTGNEAGVQLRRREGGVADHPAQESEVGTYTADTGFIQHGQQSQACFLTVFAPGDQLAEHGVVERRDAVALGHAAVDTPAWSGGGFAIQVESAGGGEEIVVWGFGVQAHLDGVAVPRYLRLGDRQRLAPS